MALNPTDKDCLHALYDYLMKRGRTGRLTEDEATHFESMKSGEEAERIAAANWYAEHVALPLIQSQLDGIDQRKVDLQSEKDALETYIT